jgi:putative heme iron utilization protein
VLARRLVRTARYGALAVLDPATGHPLASRVALSTDVDGTPLILISSLSAHTGALAAEARCSLLCGEPGRGDPLAHARITLVARARRIDRGDEATHARVRRRYLARQPKAALYADFGDFAFWRLEVQRASLNGGFGRAFELDADDVLSRPAFIDGPAKAPDSVMPDTALNAFATLEAEAVAHMNDDHPQTVDLYATALAGATTGATAGDWRLATIDANGFELTRDDEVRRVEFDTPVHDAGDLHAALIALARRAREQAARSSGPPA